MTAIVCKKLVVGQTLADEGELVGVYLYILAFFEFKKVVPYCKEVCKRLYCIGKVQE